MSKQLLSNFQAENSCPVSNVAKEEINLSEKRLKDLKILEVLSNLVRGIAAKLVSHWEQNLLYTKSKQILFRKRISMLARLKVSSLACIHVFYRPEHNAKGGSRIILKVFKC